MIARQNIRLTVAYDGTEYHGWQMQREHPTIQGAIYGAIAKITGEESSLIGSGRTDAGTHARALVANFKTAARIAAVDLMRALNSVLPRDIRILSARKVPDDFNAQRSARSKIYRYQIYRGAVMPPHLAREHFHYPYPLKLEIMNSAARDFLGQHDFASFAAQSRSDRDKKAARTIREIYRSDLRTSGRRLLYTVEGNGFLHHMVRNMVGTLLELGRGQMTLQEFRMLFHQRDRTLAGFTAPAHGLILLRVRY